MPLISIESEVPPDTAAIPEMIQEVREQGALAFDCAPGNIWVVFRAIPPAWSAGLEPTLPPPPLVTIQAKTGRSPEARQRLIKAVAHAVARAFAAVPENIWIHYQEMRPEDVIYG